MRFLFAVLGAIAACAATLPPTVLSSHGRIAEHSLIPPLLLDHGSSSRSKLSHWAFGLSTVIADDVVRLTTARQSREGYLWNTVPTQVASWTAHFGLRVHAPAALGGDGAAFWISSKTFTSGGPVVGAPEAGFQGVAIIFDTFDNDGQRDNPAVHVVVADTSTRPGQLDPSSDFSSARRSTCLYDFRNTNQDDIVHARVTYSAQLETLKVRLESQRQAFDCAVVPEVKLAPGMHFGFTAHTGQLADNHDLHYFVVTSDETPQPQSTRREVDGEEGADVLVAGTAYSHNAETEEKKRWEAKP